MASILIVDDEEGIRAVLADSLESVGHETDQAVDVIDALHHLDDRPYDVLLSDLRMPGDLDGMDLVRRARARWPDMQVIVLTAHGSVGGAVEAVKIGAFDYIEKPIGSPAELRALVQRALNWRTSPARPGRLTNSSPPGARGTPVEEASGGTSPVAGSWLRDFLWQLKRRHVYTVAVAYLAVGFIALQVAELILPALPAVPEWAYSALVVLTLAGFPVALVLGWVYDITRKGVRRTDAIES